MYLKDKVKETSSTAGTGNLVLDNVAASGCQTFSQAYGADDVPITYGIQDSAGNAEVGRGKFLGASNDGNLLLHGEGTNGGTTITDSSPQSNTVTNTAVTTSTAQFQFGSASLSFDGSTARLDLPLSAALTLGGSDLTFEAFVRPNSIAGRQDLFYWNGNVSGYAALVLRICAGGKLGLSISESGGAWRVDDTTGLGSALTANAWQHVAVTRLGGTFTLWLGGVSQGTYTPLSGTSAALNTTFTLNQIGCYNTASNRFAGYMDEVRITKGLAHYTAGFTPPAAAFTLGVKQISRDKVSMSTNSNALVNFPATSKDIWVTADADYLDNAGLNMQLAMRGLAIP